MAEDVNVVRGSARISAPEAEGVIADAESILTTSGLTRSEVQAVVRDQQAVAGEVQANAPTR